MCSMVKNENRKRRKSTESFLNKKIRSVNDYHYQCLNATNLLSNYHFGFNNKKSYFQTSMPGFVDNLKQHYKICVLNTQNPFKRALNKANGLNKSKN